MRALLLLVARARALDDAQRSFLAAYARGAGTVARPSGLLYRVKRYGFGGSPALDAACDVAYDGKLSGDWPDGPSFDGTRAKRRPSTFAASKVIACWREAMPLMTVGSVWELACPPDLAYGPRPVRGKIPGGVLHEHRLKGFGLNLIRVARRSKCLIARDHNILHRLLRHR